MTAATAAAAHIDLGAHITELADIVAAWDIATLGAALNSLRGAGHFDTPAYYVMAQTIQHRVHGRPAPTLAGFKATGAGGFGS